MLFCEKEEVEGAWGGHDVRMLPMNEGTRCRVQQEGTEDDDDDEMAARAE